MPTDVDEVIACAACGTKNRIRSGLPSGTFRCGACHALLLRPSRFGLLARAIHAAPELFFRFARGATALILLAIPVMHAYESITRPKPEPEPTKTTPTHTTPRPLPMPEAGKPKFDPDKWLAENSRPTPPPFLEPELLLPPTGEFRIFTGRERLAPFQIKSSTGANYLIKLDDSRTGAAVQTIFIRGGSTVDVDVPLGTYTVKYASGDKWYGYTHLFGPNASYSKAVSLFTFYISANKYMGHTITLYKVPGGNLHIGKIDADEF